LCFFRNKMAEKVKQEAVSQEKILARGSVFEGVVVSDKMQKTVTVRIDYTIKVKKYERMKRRHTRIKARNPSEIAAKVGDVVKIAECRPLSKTVHFVVLEKKKPKEGQKISIKKKSGKR